MFHRAVEKSNSAPGGFPPVGRTPSTGKKQTTLPFQSLKPAKKRPAQSGNSFSGISATPAAALQRKPLTKPTGTPKTGVLHTPTIDRLNSWSQPTTVEFLGSGAQRTTAQLLYSREDNAVKPPNASRFLQQKSAADANRQSPHVSGLADQKRKFPGLSREELEKQWMGRKKLFRNNARPRGDLNLAELQVSKSNIALSAEQQKVIRLVCKEHRNVFFTGSAGTGKSVVLREIIKRLNMQYGYGAVAVTAPTGIAAVNIGGTTIHRWAGIGLGNQPVSAMISKVKNSRDLREKWENTKVLIIDEISMLDASLLTALDQVGRNVLGQPYKPFGGIQLVLTGDFFQLPPVKSKELCFNCATFKTAIHTTVLLTQIFRQKGDTEFIEMLNALRYGKMSPEIIAKFRALERPVNYKDGFEPTELYPTRAEVQAANESRLRNLSGDLKVFDAHDSGPEHYRAMLEHVMAPPRLVLKRGSQVMMVKNVDQTLVNGTLGKVLFFISPSMHAVLEARAGSAFDYDDPEFLLDYDLLYQAMRRRTVPEELTRKFQLMDSKRRSLFNSLLQLSTRTTDADLLPLVRFSTPVGPRDVLVEPMEFEVSIPSGRKGEKLIRHQLPLILSWALSIHKSQGQTLERVRVDLSRIFEIGQVYVALSRAVGKDTLEIKNFDPRVCRASPEVIKFYEKLKSGEANRELKEHKRKVIEEAYVKERTRQETMSQQVQDFLDLSAPVASSSASTSRNSSQLSTKEENNKKSNDLFVPEEPFAYLKDIPITAPKLFLAESHEPLPDKEVKPTSEPTPKAQPAVVTISDDSDSEFESL